MTSPTTTSSDPQRAPLCIVLARAGSKGLPGKNVAPVAGKPCIQWTIEFAIGSRCKPVVAVSSDDRAAVACAKTCGAHVIDRPAELASDGARIDDAARHAVLELDRMLARSDGQSSRKPNERDAIVILYANVPVRPGDLLDRAVQRLQDTGCDSVQSYAPVGKFHPWWTARVSEEGAVNPWEGEMLNHGVFRRQDLPHAYIPDGGIIAVTRAALFGRVGISLERDGPHAFFGKDRRGVVNDAGTVVDIDDRMDLLVADAVLRDRLEFFR